MSHPATIEDKLNLESEHALLLEEAYQLGYHKVRNGCLIPLTEKLDAIITTETTKARIDEWRLFLNGNTEPVVRETVNHLYARERLAQLTDMVATGLGQGEATQSRPGVQKEQNE